MKTIIWNIFVGLLVIIAIIGDIQMVNKLEPPQQKEYKTQADIDRETSTYSVIIDEIEKTNKLKP